MTDVHLTRTFQYEVQDVARAPWSEQQVAHLAVGVVRVMRGTAPGCDLEESQNLCKGFKCRKWKRLDGIARSIVEATT